MADVLVVVEVVESSITERLHKVISSVSDWRRSPRQPSQDAHGWINPVDEYLDQDQDTSISFTDPSHCIRVTAEPSHLLHMSGVSEGSHIRDATA